MSERFFSVPFVPFALERNRGEEPIKNSTHLVKNLMHVARLGESEIPWKVMTKQLHRVQGLERPKLRWEDGVVDWNWKAVALDETTDKGSSKIP